MGLYVCVDNNSFVFELCDEKFGCLLDYEVVSYFFFFVWGKFIVGKIIIIDLLIIEEVYNEIL